MEASTFVKLERNHGGNVISVTRPRIGELSNDEIVQEIQSLDQAIQAGLNALDSGPVAQTETVEATPAKKTRTRKAAPKAEVEAEEEEAPTTSRKKKVAKKKTAKKTSRRAAPLSEETTERIHEAVTNIATNTIFHDEELGQEGYEEMDDDTFVERQQEFLNEVLDGAELESLGEKQGQTLLTALEGHEMYNNGYYMDGELVEEEEEEDE